MRKTVVLLCAAFLAPALAGDGIRNLRVEVEEGSPARVRVQGAASLPDKAILSIAIKTLRSDIHGQQWRLLEMNRVSVSSGAFDRVFTFENGLPFGPYKVEVDCDRGHQYPGIAIPPAPARNEPDPLHGETDFKVGFVEDITAPLKGHADAIDALAALWAELEAKFRTLSPKAKDPAALEEWKRFSEPWTERVSKAATGPAPSRDELLYPETRLALGGLSNKIQLFQADHEAVLGTGEPSETRKAHANWFEPDPSHDLASARSRLAQEFAFNTGKKVVDYGYDKATDILARLKSAPASGRAWDLFRKQLGQDLDRIEKAYRELSGGSCKAEILEIASDVPSLVAGGRELLAAGDQSVADPSKGAPAMAAVKETLKKAYKSNLDRIAASEAKRNPPPVK